MTRRERRRQVAIRYAASAIDRARKAIAVADGYLIEAQGHASSDRLALARARDLLLGVHQELTASTGDAPHPGGAATKAGGKEDMA